MYLIYIEQKHRLVALVGPFKSEGEAKMWDAAFAYINDPKVPMNLAAIETERVAAWHKAHDIRPSNYELQDMVINPYDYTLRSTRLMKAKQGEYYAEYDEDSAMWCVFHTENNPEHAYASYASEEQAEADATGRNLGATVS